MIFTFLFNFIHHSKIEDALCCVKSFFKEDIKGDSLQSKNFDIDVEIASILIKKFDSLKNVKIDYKRRSINQGKKLRLADSWPIFIRIIKSKYIH